LVDPPFAQTTAGLPTRTEAGTGKGEHELTQLVGTPTRSTRMLLERTTVLADLAGEPPVTEKELSALAGIKVLAVVGTRSPFRPAADLVARALPHARCHILGGGRDLHISAKGRLTPLLADFVGAPEGRGDGQ
jgi:hypothetical protein